ncbi:MAG: universal stress protein [Acidimicrobiales bacterium]
MICISVQGRQGGLLRSKRWSLPQLADDVLSASPAPVLVIGPSTDAGRGLPLAEIVAATDGSPASEQIIPTAVAWARELKLTFTLVGVVHTDAEDVSGEQEYLADQVAGVRGDVPEARFELLRAADPASGLLSYLQTHDDTILALTTHGRSGSGRTTLGSVAERVMEESPRAVLLQRPAASSS